jgi:hypothetical protein
VRSRSPEPDQPGLLGVKGQAVLAKALRQDVHHPSRILFPREHDHEVIGVPHQQSFALQTRSHDVLEPLVEHAMEIEVREKRRDHPALRRAVC